MKTYNEVSHLCPETGRIAMTVADAYAREDSPDRTFFAYFPKSAELGLDPWRLIDGIDKIESGTLAGDYTLEWPRGLGVSCPASRVIYMQQAA